MTLTLMSKFTTENGRKVQGNADLFRSEYGISSGKFFTSSNHKAPPKKSLVAIILTSKNIPTCFYLLSKMRVHF